MMTLDRWDDIFGGNDQYIEIGINETEAVCVKRVGDTGLIYVMECKDGLEVYPQGTGPDTYPHGTGPDEATRLLTRNECEEVMSWAREQFKVEEELDNKEEEDIYGQTPIPKRHRTAVHL